MTVDWIPARRAVTALFLFNGALTASVDASIPRLTRHLGVSPGAIGGALLLGSLAGLVAVRLSTRPINRWGSRPVLWITAVISPAALVIPLAAGSYPAFCAGLVLTGLCIGVFDNAMHSQAVSVERSAGRAVMGGMHAAWSVGAIGGASLGGLAALQDWTTGRQAMIFALVIVPGTALAGLKLMHDVALIRSGASKVDDKPRRGRFAQWFRRGRVVIVLGLLGAGCELSESGLSTWSGVYAERVGGASLHLASLSLVVLTATATLFRIASDRVQRRLGPDIVLRAGTCVAAAGLVLLLIARPLPALFAGVALLGAGLSVAVPILMGAVGRADNAGGTTATRVADYSTLSTFGLLAGPPVFGWLGQVAGFRTSFALSALTLVGLMVYAHLVAKPDERASALKPDPVAAAA